MFDNLQYRLLRRLSPAPPSCCSGSAYEGKSKLAILMGADFLARISGKVIIDFGCGEGEEVIDMLLHGAAHVTGVDIRPDVLERARRKAITAGVQDRCTFVTATNEPADVVVSIDAFEHFAEPSAVLQLMARLVAPGGEVLASFGPTWYHPLGGHLFSVFPWAHLLFSERALIRWRSDFKDDGATRFCEVAGGLNQITIAEFERLVAASPLKLDKLELVPIRKLRYLHTRLTREYTTAVVRCSLVRR